MFTKTSDAIKKKKKNQKKLCYHNLFTPIVLFPICFRYRKRVCNRKLAFGVVEVFVIFKTKDHNRVFLENYIISNINILEVILRKRKQK